MSDLQKQQGCFNNINTLCTNYRKDSSSRKTQDYLNTRLASLGEYWEDFENRHKILVHESGDRTQQYFTENVYDKTKALYESTKADMLNMLRYFSEQDCNVQFNLADTIDDRSDDGIKALLGKQERNFKAIDRAMSKIVIHATSEKWELEDHLNILKAKWDSIDKVHWELDAHFKGSNDTYYSMFINTEDKYDELKRNLNKKIWSSAHYQHSAPRVEVPEFSGNYTQWISFKDLFVETIHNNPSINTAQKMQHLKTKLRGEAERLVQHLTISADNYSSCWQILNQRYDNRRLQFTSYANTMLNLPLLQQPDAYSLKKMHDVITECLNGLANIGVETTSWDPIIVHLMSQKLDTTTYNDYMRELQNHRDLPILSDFLSFLESKFMAFETMRHPKKENVSYTKPTTFTRPVNKQYSNFRGASPKIYHAVYGNCTLCDGNHVLMQCPKFIDLDPTQRNITIAKLRVCKNCLYSHGNSECKSIKTCKECNMRHHTLLHNPVKKTMSHFYKVKNNFSGQRPSTSTSSTQPPAANHLSSDEMEILLTTVQLKVQSVDGTYVTLRALLDQGSQVNLITENAAQLLRLPRRKLYATISGIGESSKDCKGRLQLSCKSLYSDYTFELQAFIMNKLTNNLPNSTFKKENWPHLQNLKLADPDYNMSRSVDLLLGAEVYAKIIQDGVLKGPMQAPIAQQTHLGWILCGKLKTFNCHVTLINLDEITKFWETEDIAQGNEDISKEDQCEDFYSKTVQRGSDGRYIVKMPFCSDYEEKIGHSKSIAISQLLQLEKKLQRQAKLAKMYKEFIKEYVDLGHMKLSTPTVQLEYFMPHHGVLRENAETTQLRVVFNASQKSSNGLSLNSLQEKGPKLQKDIQALILKWRTYKYAFTADIEKMFRCIWISEEQQPLQKIVWRNSPNERIQEYQLCTVTYGTKCAPWLAMRTLKQLAMDDEHKYPAAAKVLQNEFYVDDLVSGHNSLEAAKELQLALINLLKGGGMNLRKWSTNHPALQENLRKDQISTGKVFDFKHEESTKTLGLGWNQNTDTFVLNWNLDLMKRTALTKRTLLSEISKLYDPLGWLAPVTVTAKLLFQRVWVSKLGWDDVLPVDIQNDWIKLKTELPDLKNIKLNRWIGVTDKVIELFGFCDASEKAFSCVIYSRAPIEQGKFTITLLAAKTRVAPLTQKTSLPRLELSAALLLSQLIDKTKKALMGHEIKVQAWSDSQVVLAWLQGDTSKWEQYVANRVTRIKQIIPAEQWHYVKSEQNSADCATRGLYPGKLIKLKLWWEGPEFLKTFRCQAEPKPITCLFTTKQGELQEAKIAAKNHNKHLTNELLFKYSSLTKVIRVTAWAMRFSARARNSKKFDTTYLTTSELAASTELIIKYAQQTEFEHEYKQLLKKENLTNKSSMFKLNPYIDEKGILRVGGRLTNSNLPLKMKNPIILPRNGRLTQLVIEHAHKSTLHGGARLTLAHLRERYWIIGGNKAVKSRLLHCVPCHRYKITNNYQLMGDLPRQRVTPSRPFSHTGVDFTGHVEIKLNKGRGVKTSKGYIAIFICMATKAVHIELVSDLSTETFIAAFQRFCARRGTPKHMYSDCGTNFVGASRTLRREFEEFKNILSPNFFEEIGKLEVEWHFNVPAWPSAGGAWESSVKSLKHHLRRVLGSQKLTYEEFGTLLAKIEACMNSRPLCPLTEDPDEFYNYLTPGHFLTGTPTMALPLSDYSDVATIDLRRRWQLTEHMFQQFWKNWSNEYLSQLQIRSKWNKPQPNIKEGDIVLVKDNNLPPGKWAMGRVLQLHPGADGYVRVTTIKTQTGTIKRPIVKLSPLPIENEVKIEKNEENKDLNQPVSKITSPTARTEKRSKKNLSRAFTLFTTFITMCAVMSESRADEPTVAQITNIERERPIYYDAMGNIQIIHDEWTLLMYYNLTNYWEGVRRIQTYLQGVKDLCQKTDPRYCQTTLDQLYHEMDLLSYYNTILLAPHKHLSNRRKRGLIDGVGYITNSLFGILDQRFADKYQNDIKAVQNNEKYLLQLIKNQTSIVELENTVLKKSEENIKQQFITMENFMKQTDANIAKVQSELEIAMATSFFNSASLAAHLLLNNLKSVQEMLFNTLTDVYKGHMDVHLVTPVNLVRQLTDISGKLPRTLSLPVENISEEVKDFYKLLYIKARVTDNYFMFEIHIPLTSDEYFTLHQAIPLPVRTNSSIAIMATTSKYIAVNFRKNIFISLSEELLKQCIQQKPDSYLCNKNLPVFNLHNNNIPCEAKLLSHRMTSQCDVTVASCKDTWIELHAPNTWLAICCDTCALRTICENEVTAYTLTSSGIVTLPQGCLLQSNYLTIYSHNQYNSKIKINYNFNVPTLNTSANGIVNLTYHKAATVHLSQPEEFTEIERRLVSQREQENELSTPLSNIDIHQFAISYLLLGIAVLCLIFWVAKRRFPLLCTKRKPRSHCSLKSVKPHYEDIELQTIPQKRITGPEDAKPSTSRTKRHRQDYATVDNIAFHFD